MARRKAYLPQKITTRTPSSLTNPQVRMLLDFLGVPLNAQPKSKKDKDARLAELIESDAARVQQAYDVIVLGKLPEAPKEVQEEIDAVKSHFASAMSRLLEDEQMDKLGTAISNMAKDLENRLLAAGKKAVAEAADNYRPIVIKQGKKQTKVKGVLPNEFGHIVQLASQRVPVMMVGPAGCGKTYIAGKVAEALGLDSYDQSCSEGVSESTFTGWLLPIGSNGAFQYVPSPFIEAYEKGGVFLLDEIDAADPNLLTFLNKAIANESFMLPQRFKKPLVKKHPDFVVLAAANTFGKGADAEYVGRNALDAATLDRFRAGMVHMDYSAEVEDALVNPMVLEWGRKVRSFIYKHKLHRIMSTRILLDFTKMVDNCEWTIEDCAKAFFADWSRDELALWEREGQ